MADAIYPVPAEWAESALVNNASYASMAVR
jgi:hypothetical protein